MPIFPESGFDQSAITPVFLGVLVSWFFTETFGWVFVGLVVPGYLATLFVLDPRSAAIDVAEAVLTYAVARVLCEHLSRTGLTSRMFGRERFLLILVVSVLVRLAVEGGVMRWALPHAKWAYSIGLVVVPLAANACWKTGLVRGAVESAVPTFAVYALLRWLLLPHTNLSLAGFHLSIENVASSFLRSPRAYVLLLTGALLAAVANVRYGWDYGGILLPALIALVVGTPTKLAATFLEAAVLVGIVALLVRFTRVGRWNIEGPRRPVLFLSVDYLLRFALAALAGRHLPGTEIVELTGLGYLLPSLLAVKVSQKAVAALVFLPTMTVSVVAFAASSALAAVVTSFGGAALASGPAVTRRVGTAPAAPGAAALWVSALSRPASEHATPTDVGELSTLARAVIAVARAQRQEIAGREVQRLSDGVVLIRERFADLDHRRGSAAVLISSRSPVEPKLVGVVPSPLAAPQAAALAGYWLEQRGLDALVIAGAEERRSGEGGANEALALARELADSDARRGLVIAIRGNTEHCRVRTWPRAQSHDAAHAFLEQHASALPDCELSEGRLRGGEDIALEVPAVAADRWLLAPLIAPQMTTNSSLAFVASDVRLTDAKPSLEELLVLRRLVLEPLLVNVAEPPISLAVSRAAADGLGYQLFGPTPLPDGSEGMLLLPGVNGAPLALVARRGGVRGPVLELPHAGSAPLRAVALRLFKPLRADALIMGLEAGEGALDNEAFAEAHAAAVWPHADRTSSLISLREGPDVDAPGLGLAAWGGEGARQLSGLVVAALATLQLSTRAEPMDHDTREQAGRSVFGDTPVVSITVGRNTLRSTGLSADADPLRVFGSLPVTDTDLGAAIGALAQSLPASAPDAPESVLDIAGAAATEHSVVAARSLESLIQRSACRASVVRADSGIFLSLAARHEHMLLVAAFPLLFIAAPPHIDHFVAPTLAACSAKLASGGICRVEVQP